MLKSYYIRGAIGDSIYGLAALKAVGGGILYSGLPMAHFKALEPLVGIQPYIKGFYHESEGLPKGFINLEDFVFLQKNPNHICESFAKVLGIEVDYKNPWLTLPPDIDPPPRFSYAVINVTPRYRDKVYNYRRELKFLKDNTDEKVCFLGKLEEYEAFTKRYGRERMTWVKTETLLEAAKIIRRAKYFTGTQSSLLAIAEGLGRSYRFERSPFHDNCRTGRANETIINNGISRKIHLAYSRAQEVYRMFKS